MKIKNIIPIFIALFVVACSATGNNRNNSSNSNSGSGSGGGITFPSIDFTTLPIPSGNYVALLEGEILDEVSDRTLVTDAEHYRTRGFGGYIRETADRILFDNLSNPLAFTEQYTNDTVEDLYLKRNSSGTPMSLVKLTATTANGTYPSTQGAVRTRTGEFSELGAMQITVGAEVTAMPTVFLGETGTETFDTRGYRLYNVTINRATQKFDFDLNGEFDSREIYVVRDTVGEYAFLLLAEADNSILWLEVRQTASSGRYHLLNSPERMRIFSVRVN